MSEENSHVSVKPSESVSKEAEKRVESKSGRKGEPEFHLTEQMRRLSTPWGIALARARQIDPGSLGPGIILDAAVGSGLQLIAYSSVLKRPSLGVEIDGNVAVLCAANMFSVAGKDDIQRSMDRVVIGDSTDSVGVMNEFWSSLRESGTRAHPPVAMLHLDPARPRDAQKHHIDEMEPPIESVLSSWKQYLELGPRGPCIILDLSPRLDIEQRSMIDEIVEKLFPGCGRTWEWMSRGGGRVDRLSLWIGSLSSGEARRCIRMGTKKIMSQIEGDGDEVKAIRLLDPPPFESWITIVDPVVLESGLQHEWISRAIPDGSGYSWIRTDGRRPLLIHTEPINEDDDVRGFVVSTGQVVQHRLSPPEDHTISQIASSLARLEIGSLTLRCSLDPDMHPKLQRRLHKAMREIEGSRSFMVDIELSRDTGNYTMFVVCRED
tara:strand:- start:1470 stop:2774 length:1305 start_codon:yes stop_codon:yes gene_type:complete